LHYLILQIHFTDVVILAVLINFILVWFISFYSLEHGELVDPITPVIAAILDIVVDLCYTIGHQVETWARLGPDDERADLRQGRNASSSVSAATIAGGVVTVCLYDRSYFALSTGRC
jgi:hypothetical protein